MVETRQLVESISFPDAADEWAKSRNLLTNGGQPVASFPAIIGMPSGSTDLGAFNLGIIQDNRTIKQGMQDLETATNDRLLNSNNLADVVSTSTARTNLGLGTASTKNTGTSGDNIPLLNTSNTWSSIQYIRQNLVIDRGSDSSESRIDMISNSGQYGRLRWYSGTSNDASSLRWTLGKTSGSESGSNAGSDFRLDRFDDTGSSLGSVMTINRSTGTMSLSTPLPITSGGTGSSTVAQAKTALGLNNLDNTSDANKPISIATQAALNTKLNLNGSDTMTGSLSVTAANQALFKFESGTNPTVIHRNDGSNYYFLLSAASAGVNSSFNNLRPFTINTSTGLLSSANGQSFSGGMSVFNNGTVASFEGNGSQYQGISIRNSFGSSGQDATGFLDYRNENNITVANISADINANGNANLSFGVTQPGSRATDRRTVGMVLSASALVMNVPINGRAYPRKADGSSFDVTWAGQNGQPSWYLGSNDGVTFLPYNPSNLSVSYSQTAGIVSPPGLSGASEANLVYAQMADNDMFRIRVGGTGPNAGWVEIATADDGTEPIMVRQYSGVFASVVREAALLDGNGNTSFPNGLYAPNHYASGWFRLTADNGIYWDNRGRGIAVADNGSTYGNIGTYGSGLNGWAGFSIGNWASFMSNGSEVGIHSPQKGDWLLRIDNNKDAFFSGNVTAYSDERLKQNKRPIDDVEKRRKGMAKAAILYERNGQTRVGFGAQTLELSNPEVVKTADDLVGTKSVSYGDLVAVLAVDNQNLSDKLHSQQMTIISQSNTINEMKSMIDDLVSRLEKAGL